MGRKEGQRSPSQEAAEGEGGAGSPVTYFPAAISGLHVVGCALGWGLEKNKV